MNRFSFSGTPPKGLGKGVGFLLAAGGLLYSGVQSVFTGKSVF